MIKEKANYLIDWLIDWSNGHQMSIINTHTYREITLASMNMYIVVVWNMIDTNTHTNKHRKIWNNRNEKFFFSRFKMNVGCEKKSNKDLKDPTQTNRNIKWHKISFTKKKAYFPLIFHVERQIVFFPNFFSGNKIFSIGIEELYRYCWLDFCFHLDEKFFPVFFYISSKIIRLVWSFWRFKRTKNKKNWWK